MSDVASLSQEVIARLAWTSLQATLLVGAVWLLNRLLPRLSAATRSLLWWLLGVQLLLGLLLPTPVALPLLSPAPHTQVTITTTTRTTPSEHHIAGFDQRSSAAQAQGEEQTIIVHSSKSSPRAWTSWLTAIFALWLSGVIVQTIVTLRHWREARRVVRASQPLDDAALQALCAEQAQALGLRRCPSLRVSAAIRSPQVSGLWRPTVLLPADQNLSSEESALALAHELTHLRRGDLWMGWIPAIAQRLFFFHPMVWWAMREYALNREAACDAQVVHQHDATPQDYGRLLLRLGVAHPLHAGLAGASPTFHNLKRRLTMLQMSDQDTTSRVRSWLLVALVAAVGVLPYRVTEAKGDSAVAPASSASAMTVPATPPTPATPATPATPVTPATPATPHSKPSSRGSMTPPVPPVPPVPNAPLPPPPPPPPPAPPAPPASGFSAHNVDIDTHSDAKYGFALLDKDSVIINGGEQDVATAKRMRDPNASLVMFRRGDQSYVIRDQAYIARAKAAYAPVTELAQQQGQLAGQQGQLSGEEGGIGARQGSLGARLGRIASREAAVAQRQAQHGTPDAGEGERAGFEAERNEIEREVKELERQQQGLEQRQEVLAKQQEALSHREEQVSGQAAAQMNRLIDEALAKGAAQQLSDR